MTQSPVISTTELQKLLGQAHLKIIDASWWMNGRDARADFEQAHIAGAVFIDIDEVSDATSDLPHTLPSHDQFAAVMSRNGISHNDQIVVYDTQGLFSAARVWWLLRLFGAEQAQVLDGGLPKWLADGYATQSGPSNPTPLATFSAKPSASKVASFEDVREALGSDVQILDARGAPRFNAVVPEPRKGVRSGHMPAALNLPYTQLLNADGTIKDGPLLEAAFKDIGFDFDRPVITSCGSGVTAAILTLGLEILGKPSRLYDGSWTEWGSRMDTPIAP